FVHDQVREVVYAIAGEPRRGALHRRALEVLRERKAPAAELFRHAAAAGLKDQAFDLAVAAGDHALKVFAARDAVEHYQRARRLLAGGGLGVASPPAAHHLYAQLGRAHEAVGEY